MFVLASLAIPSLALVCVVVWACVFHMFESFKFKGGVMDGFCDSTLSFISGIVSVLLCNEALGTSSSLAVEGEAVSVSF